MENKRYVLLKKDEDNGYYFIREDGNDRTDVFYDKHTGIIVFKSIENVCDPTTEEMYFLLLDLIACPLPNLPSKFGAVESRLVCEQNVIKKLMDLQTWLEVAIVMEGLPNIPAFVVVEKEKEVFGNIYFLDKNGRGRRTKNLYSKNQALCWLEEFADKCGIDSFEREILQKEIEETDQENFPACLEDDLIKYN
jgi:hypothetical protein